MENDLTAGGSSLDKFLTKITSDVLRTALEKVSDRVVEMDDEDFLLEHLNNESFKDSVKETSGIQHPDLPEIKSDLEDVSKAYIQERCYKLVEDTFLEVHDELRRIFDSNKQEMPSDMESSKKKLQLLDCIKDSDRLQAYFQELSLSVIQNAFDQIKIVENSKHFKKEPYLVSDIESDIASSIGIKEGSESRVGNHFSNNIDVEINHAHENSPRNESQLAREDLKSQVDLVNDNEVSLQDLEQMKSASTSGSLGFTTAYSVMYQASDSYNGQSSNRDSYFSATNDTNLSQGISEHTTVDSAMFTTADEFTETSSDSTFLSFEKSTPQQATTVAHSTPGRGADRNNSDIDTTLTEMSGPRQSTPLADGKSKNQHTTLPAAEASDILHNDLTQNGSNDMAEYERTLQELSGEESSFGDPSSPRTLSRQSSAFGNVTLEFDTDWEASMKGMQGEAGNKSKPEEKHKVILHELSFEDHHRLKAPELLCPVFLAVQDDDDDDDGDEERRKKYRISQSIDDLCEMISEDDDDQDLPLRRRALSLEGKRPPAKDQRKKAPTREELMAAFEELQNEILEEKDIEQEGIEKTNNEDKDEEPKGTVEEIMDNQESNGLDDPLRWHTVVFNGQHKVIDLKLLEPFLKVLTHGGYHHEDDKKTVIVVLTACNLPNKKMKRYPFLMEQLFFFIISTMDLLVTSEEYIFVYFHGGTSKSQSPSFSWIKKYYQYIDHRLRKSVTKVYVVHPNLWLKSVFRLCRPFLSSNFARKLKFVNSLKELSGHIKTDFIFIPDEVVRVDPGYKKIHAN